MLKRLTRLYKLGGGGRLDSGNQYMSWIALDDLLAVLLESIANPALDGPLNAVAPGAVTNAEFTSTLAGVLNRPTIARVPAPILRLTAGELADELLLVSQLASPSRLTETGFQFEFPTLESALRHEFGRPGTRRSAQFAASPEPTLLPSGRGD
jgi:NAD dependent epimerase/dehydratase family enzyme